MRCGVRRVNGPLAADAELPLKGAAAAKASGDWSIITRDDGSKQWAYKGKRVYNWSKDTKAGDKTGDNFNNLWHVAKQ